jgi:hypothetical protein
MAKTAKEKHKINLLEYLGNPENPFCNRNSMALALGIKRVTLYAHFTPTELTEIEEEALETRRKKYAPKIASADNALFKQAERGDVHAIKLVYQRFEDWGEKQKRELQHEFPHLVEAIEAAKAEDES